MFSFREFGKSIEELIKGWYEHTQSVLEQSSDLGFAREHFIENVLRSFMPKSVVIGSGEIVDGEGQRSGQQDVIIYRADFPILTSFTPVNTYLIEGVIATIEVKSNLSTGSPNGLAAAFKGVQGVRSLERRAVAVEGETEHIERIKRIHTVKSYVVGYAGCQMGDFLLQHYVMSANSVDWLVPHLVYQPGACILLDDGFEQIEDEVSVDLDRDQPQIVLCEGDTFAVFLRHLLRAVLLSTGGLVAEFPGIEAKLLYGLEHYFELRPRVECKRVPPERPNRV